MRGLTYQAGDGAEAKRAEPSGSAVPRARHGLRTRRLLEPVSAIGDWSVIPTRRECKTSRRHRVDWSGKRSARHFPARPHLPAIAALHKANFLEKYCLINLYGAILCLQFAHSRKYILILGRHPSKICLRWEFPKVRRF